ncbi:MAG: high-potential iron-sulfur protein [Candidatus Baltobacteraceae bacterium]
MDKISRAEALKGLIVLPLLAAAVAGTAGQADAGSKAQFKYQNKPKGSAKCGNCRFFRAPKSHKGNGACSLVSGPISPNGWCIAWAKK